MVLNGKKNFKTYYFFFLNKKNNQIFTDPIKILKFDEKLKTVIKIVIPTCFIYTLVKRAHKKVII